MPAEVLTDGKTTESTDVAIDETLLEPVLGELLGLDKDVELGVFEAEETRELLGDGEILEYIPDGDHRELEPMFEGVPELDDDVVPGKLVVEKTV